MSDVAAESTQDWLLPERLRPPLIGELTRRVDEALITARASEAAVMTVGAAAFDAAEQARRAAELAERASAAALAARTAQQPEAVLPSASSTEDEGLRYFSERADRLVARLRQLQRLPLGAPRASAGTDVPLSGR